MTRSVCTSTMIGGFLLDALLCLGLAVGAEPTTGNQALRLNSQSDFVRVADSQSLHSFTSAITIEAWFKALSFAPNNGDWKRQSYYKPTREQIAQDALYGWVHDDNFNGIMSRSDSLTRVNAVLRTQSHPAVSILLMNRRPNGKIRHLRRVSSWASANRIQTSAIRIGRVDSMACRIVRSFSALLCLLGPVASAMAAITIDGVEDRKVYSNRVAFTVRPEAGFEYTAELNGTPVAVGTAVEVAEPDYYELSVRRMNSLTSIEENEFIQFIVRATDRGNAEWGLPRWTPYPMIDSAAAEFAGATLQIVAPAEYPLGLEIPIIARVEDPSGHRVGVTGVVTAAEFEAHPLRLLRGVGSAFLPAATTTGDVS